jgi:hypothetical protein
MESNLGLGGVMAQAVSGRPLTADARVRPGSVHVGFVVDKVALKTGLFPSSSFFSCRYRSTLALQTHI